MSVTFKHAMQARVPAARPSGSEPSSAHLPTIPLSTSTSIRSIDVACHAPTTTVVIIPRPGWPPAHLAARCLRCLRLAGGSWSVAAVLHKVRDGRLEVVYPSRHLVHCGGGQLALRRSDKKSLAGLSCRWRSPDHPTPLGRESEWSRGPTTKAPMSGQGPAWKIPPHEHEHEPPVPELALRPPCRSRAGAQLWPPGTGGRELRPTHSEHCVPSAPSHPPSDSFPTHRTCSLMSSKRDSSWLSSVSTWARGSVKSPGRARTHAAVLSLLASVQHDSLQAPTRTHKATQLSRARDVLGVDGASSSTSSCGGRRRVLGRGGVVGGRWWERLGLALLGAALARDSRGREGGGGAHREGGRDMGYELEMVLLLMMMSERAQARPARRVFRSCTCGVPVCGKSATEQLPILADSEQRRCGGGQRVMHGEERWCTEVGCGLVHLGACCRRAFDLC